MKRRKRLSVLLVMVIILTSSISLPHAIAASCTASVDASTTYQTLEGFGAAIAWLQSKVTEHPNKAELYNTLFSDSGLDILRLRAQYRNEPGFDYQDTETVKTAKAINPSLKILLCSWGPPADIKKDGIMNGGTLKKDNSGAFMYNEFGDYWLNTLNAYKTKGIVPDYISIQNEPDYENTGWETCIFKPTEDSNYPSYGKALDAVYSKISSISPMPNILAAEETGTGYNKVQDYTNNFDLTKVYGLAHHLYNGGDANNPDSFNSTFQTIKNKYGSVKPIFMTEYDQGSALNTAQLVHNSLVEEGVCSYIYWDLIWDDSNQRALVVVDNPFNIPSSWKNLSGYTKSDYYYAMKHFSKFTDPGYKRVAATSSNSDVKISSFISPDSNRLTTVLINGASSENTVSLSLNGFTPADTAVFRTTFSGTTERFASLGSLSGNSVTMPAQSVVTVVADTSSIVINTPSPIPTPTPKPTSRSAFEKTQAEDYNSMSGIQTELIDDYGNRTVGYIENGDYITFNGVDFGTGATSFQACVASATSGGSIEIRVDGAYTSTLATIAAPGTGSWSKYTTVSSDISSITGKHDLTLFFSGGSGYLNNLDWFKFTGGGMTPTPTPTPTPTQTPTPTPTSTPTATPTTTPTTTPTPTPTITPIPDGIKVQFFNSVTSSINNTLYTNFKLVNIGTAAISLSDVKLRYYFTNDGTQMDSYSCDYSSVGNSNTTGIFTTINKTNADRYLEVGFTSGAGSLAPGASIEVKGRVWKSDWSSFTQTNDYSFNANATNYVDSNTVTAYISDILKWGSEP